MKHAVWHKDINIYDTQKCEKKKKKTIKNKNEKKIWTVGSPEKEKIN